MVGCPTEMELFAGAAAVPDDSAGFGDPLPIVFAEGGAFVLRRCVGGWRVFWVVRGPPRVAHLACALCIQGVRTDGEFVS